VFQSLLSGEADIGLAYRMPPHPNIIVTAHFTTQIGAVVSPDHPFAKRPSIRLTDCLDHTVVMADPSLTIHPLIMNAFLLQKIEFRPGYVSNSVELMKGMARTQQAITFLSRIDVAQDVAEGMLVFVPLHDGALLTNQLALARRDMARRSPAVTVLEEYIREAFHSLTE
jgi:DNA-binding transcriptional LysR family regulator